MNIHLSPSEFEQLLEMLERRNNKCWRDYKRARERVGQHYNPDYVKIMP